MAESFALTEAFYYILLSLYQPLHGYGIMQKAAEFSGGRVRLAAGTLYGALNVLLEKGWIEALPVEAGSRKRNTASPTRARRRWKRNLPGWRNW